MQHSKIVLILPFYEDQASKYFCEELSAKFGTHLDLIFVDDGSIRTPLEVEDLKTHGLTGHIIRLKRNVGHQHAIAVGLAYAVENINFSRAIIMDSDGEDRPQDIQRLLKHLDKTDTDIVVAKRASRQESVRFKAFYFVYKLLFRVLVGRTIGFGNFMVMNELAAKRLARSRETQTHLAASALNSKLRIANVLIDRGKRYAGKSKMNLVSLTLHGLRSVMVFSENVLVRITLFCATFTGLILLALAIMVILKITGLTIVGWFSTISGILLLLLSQIAIMALLMLLLAGNLRAGQTGRVEHIDLIEEIVNVE